MVDVVELMARAAAEADGEPENWQAWVGNCRAAFAAIEAAGFAVVPVKPTPAIVRARNPDDRFTKAMLDEGEYYFSNTKSAGRFAADLWRAMVEAGRIREDGK